MENRNLCANCGGKFSGNRKESTKEAGFCEECVNYYHTETDKYSPEYSLRTHVELAGPSGYNIGE